MKRLHLGACAIPSAPQNVANGRRWLMALLEPLFGPEHSVCEEGVLLLSETLTNAIVHGTGAFVEVDVFVDALNVRIEVTDEGGSTLPHHRDDPDGESGRGLPILGALAKSWGFVHLDDGRLRVWFELPHTLVPDDNDRPAGEPGGTRTRVITSTSTGKPGP
ncbi:anti-sigma regulatory factor (Ser/Thr protein kinase) [Actinomadura pelletieri DSM 43383]|uniref:Anti-sigma regulatory factor (Ser/Thr protein kinase) n=1 Tax=Actinomadura pelletieri DSM 43383 TaxID=1120940 RepID=A0A495QI67_9ACTN|nr:ATP-binding protein [Actinomadura pelletieri]RKS71850.1 anti-sigma regulatory factor (Ser/Thr protein kinase) [Actinomadura pelletieri DSM 43383]